MAYSGAANLSMFSRRSIYSNTRFSHSKFTCSICYFIICVNERHAYDAGSRQHVNYVADINGHKMTWRKQETPLQAVRIKLTEFVFCSSERWQGEPNLDVNLWVKKGGWQTMYHRKHFLCSTIILLFRFVSEHCLRSTLRLFQLLVVFVQCSLYTSLKLRRFFNFQHQLILW